MKISNILESFDSAPVPWKWNASADDHRVFAAFIIDNIRYEVVISNENEDDEIEVTFSGNNRDYLINKGNQYKVLNTVIDIIRTFVTKNYEHINSIYFESLKESPIYTRGSNARSQVYERLIKKNLASFPGNWKLTRRDDSDHAIFKIVKQE